MALLVMLYLFFCKEVWLMKVKGTINASDYIYSVLYKIWLRIHGAQVGKKVILCIGCRITAQHINIGAYTVIGRHVTITANKIRVGENCLFYAETIVFCNYLFEVGKRSKISRQCIFRANNIQIGKELWCNEQVKIGEGGWNQSQGNLFIGDHQFIGPRSTINLSSKVVLKGYGGLGVETAIYTHGAGNGQPITEGYYAEQHGVVVGKNVSILTRAMVMPNITIQNGVTVAANAIVTHNVAKDSLVAGIPARVIKRSKIRLDSVQRSSLIINAISEGLGVGGEAINKFNHFWSGKQDIYYYYYYKGQKVPNFNSILVFFEGSTKLLHDSLMRGGTVIDLKKRMIQGCTTYTTEKLRDKFRRKGIILSFSDYCPYKLNFNKFLIDHVENP
ncbi:hypothetical protein IV83_GL001658 [Pediococcus inopinatus]|nr:hypothetical protein IV83_GL001658 [Pediococcus inopinatus]